jgi:hypothetical protein
MKRKHPKTLSELPELNASIIDRAHRNGDAYMKVWCDKSFYAYYEAMRVIDNCEGEGSTFYVYGEIMFLLGVRYAAQHEPAVRQALEDAAKLGGER